MGKYLSLYPVYGIIRGDYAILLNTDIMTVNYRDSFVNRKRYRDLEKRYGWQINQT